MYPCSSTALGGRPDHQQRLWLSRPRSRVCEDVMACHDDAIRFTDDCQCCCTAASSLRQLEMRFCHCISVLEATQADGSQFRPTSGIFEGSLVWTLSDRSKEAHSIGPIILRVKRVCIFAQLRVDSTAQRTRYCGPASSFGASSALHAPSAEAFG